MNKNLYLTIGVPGAGKSTYINNYFEKVKIISRDKIRYSLLTPQDEYFDKEKEVYKTFVRLTQEALDEENDFDVVADATFLTNKSRDKFLKAVNRENDVYFVYFNTPLEICLKNNAKRTGRERVPDNVIQEMSERLELPDKGKTIIIEYQEKDIV